MTSETLRNTSSATASAGLSRWRRVAGAAILVTCLAGSALLAADQLRRLSLPGCTVQSGCQELTSGRWGTLGTTGWPISFLGVAYFAGLLAAWLLSSPAGVPWSLRWLTRLGLIGSACFAGIMYWEQRFCIYCAVVHAGNLAFWLIVETTAAGPLPRRPAVAFLAMAAVMVLTLSLTQARLRKKADEQANVELRASIRQIVHVSRGQSEPLTGRPAFQGRYARGPAESPIRLVVFTDYQCPYCRVLDEIIHRTIKGHGDVRFSVKHDPLCADCNPALSGQQFHPNACRAAYAAEAAGLLGGDDGFWVMHRWLFDHNGNFTDEQLKAELPKLGFQDAPKFLAAMNGAAVRANVDRDVQDAQRFGVTGTPSPFVNGVGVKGLGSTQALDELLTTLDGENLPSRTAQFDRPALVVDGLYRAWVRQPIVDIPADKCRWKLGPETAPIRVALFLDCHKPWSAELAAQARDWGAKQRDVRVEFYHFPFTEEALDPSRLVEAAGRIGGQDAFWRMHDWFCDKGEKSTAEDGLAAAAALKLDREKLAAEFAKPSVRQAVDNDIRLGVDCHVNGAPRLYLNGRLIDQAKPSKELLERFLEGARHPDPLPAAGQAEAPVTPTGAEGEDADSTVRPTGSPPQ